TDRVLSAARQRGQQLVTYGFAEHCDVVLETTGPADKPQHSFGQVQLTGRPGGPADGLAISLALPAPGQHVAADLAAAFLAVSLGAGFGAAAVAEALTGFRGTGRRFELIGEVDQIRVIDDYGHHPTELRALLQAARQVTKGRLLLLFQPAHYTRTAAFSSQFASALAGADHSVLLDVHSDRETPIAGVDGALIARQCPADQVVYMPDRAAAVAHLVAMARPGDLIITAGSGDVGALAPDLVAGLQQRKRAGQ
ncbi:MAG: hypothetical protein LBG70_02760, partial [Bifidobacteriaceae bacterium]|nr:hypothetical protein [Bifidobacteriaceae bacterium]